jgi:spermidine/putrescine ABC transporter ATP-binding subunit
MLKIENLSKYYGEAAAVNDVSIELKKGKFLTILGPSGSGKTTTLMSVAGFIVPDKGHIYIAGQDITKLLPYKRNIGIVFQNYALFPHMTVLQNVVYPLKMRHVPKAECQRKAMEYLGIVGLDGLETRYPRELSGGQQQRVALARALVYNPPVLLMDEPLGALDKQLRQRMQLEIKDIQKKLDITVIYVTHDQEEAMTMSDEIIIMNHGRIEQQGTPWALYESPVNKFVAEFMGESNLLWAKVVRPATKAETGLAMLKNNMTVEFSTDKQLSADDEIIVSIRPEHVTVSNVPVSGSLEGTIEETIYLGEATRFKIRLANGDVCVYAKQTKVLFSELEYPQSKGRVYVSFDTDSNVVLTK